MTTKSKLNFGRVNAATLARIHDLRTALGFFKLNPNSTVYDLHDNHPEWSASKCTKMSRNLVTCGLIRVSGQTKGSTSPRNAYSATVHTQADIDRELPIDIELSRTSGRSEEKETNHKVVTKWEHTDIRRDPLTAALMGSGLAPSLTFDQRYAAYDRLGVNFMNSSTGG